MRLLFIVAQVVGVLAWLFFFMSYHSKRLNQVILFQMISSILYCVNYAFIGAWTGFCVNFIDTLKQIGYYKTDKEKYLFLGTIPLYIIFGFLSERSWIAIVPIVASLIDGYVTIKSKKATVIGGIISNMLWIFYDFLFFDLVMIVTDILLVLSNLSIIVYGYSKFLRRDHVYTVIGTYITKDTLKKIQKLDKEFYDKEYRSDVDTMKKLYKAENNSYILLKDGSKVVGYVNILSLKKTKYDQINESDEIHEIVDDDYIKPLKNGKYHYLNINAIVVKEEYQNKDTVEKLVYAINKYIKMKNKRGYNIKRVNTYVVTDFEQRVVEELEYQKLKDITNESFLYECVV